VGPLVVVLLLPSFEDAPGILEIAKPVLREALSSDGRVEGLGEGVVDGLARPREDQVDPIPEGPGIDRNGFPRLRVDDRQEIQTPAVGQRVVHEVHRPGLVRRLGLRLLDSPGGTSTTLRPLPAQPQPLLDVEPVRPLVVDLPALSPQVDVYLPIPGMGPSA